MPSEAIIKFKVFPKPESSGVRILSTDPKGIFISCIDSKAAFDSFEDAMTFMSVECELIEKYPGQQIKNKIEWDKILEAGGEGQGIIILVTDEQIQDVMENGYKIEASSTDSCQVDYLVDPTGYPLCIGHDRENMDEWLLEQVKIFIEERKNA